MARLITLKPTLQRMGSKVKTLQHTRNPEAEHRQRGRKWMTIRARWFSAHPLCVECERIGRTTVATQLDHITPLIDGGADDEANYQGLCVPCHDAKTVREARARGRG